MSDFGDPLDPEANVGSEQPFDGSYAIVQTRLESLHRAIASRDWAETEFQCDRVRRAITKWRDGMARTADGIQAILDSSAARQ